LLEELLVKIVSPIITQIIAGRHFENLFVGNQRIDKKDVEHDVYLLLIKHLRTLRRNPHCRPISNFPHYVAKITANARKSLLRKNSPQWVSLKNKIHYLCTKDRRFALCLGEEESWLCGLSSWPHKNRNEAVVDIGGLSQFIARVCW
jgi:hypothetical protein